MRYIWHHALVLFQQEKVRYPVLCAIGCGAFAGDIKNVTESYAQALVDVLCHYGYDMSVVFVSLPNATHHKVFTEIITRSSRRLKCMVALTNVHGMVGLAQSISEQLNEKSGILNPSDVLAVRKGRMGMHWYHGHIALEQAILGSNAERLRPRSLWPFRPRCYSSTVTSIQICGQRIPDHHASEIYHSH